MTSPPPETNTSPMPQRGKPTRAQRAVAFTFLSAFALTMVTVILTGLNVQRPGSRRGPDTPAVTLTIDVPRTINLVFAARVAVDDVEVTVDVPAGIELVGHGGERRIVLRESLAAGDNALPLTLVARNGRGGQLAARLRQRDDQKTFVVDVIVASP